MAKTYFSEFNRSVPPIPVTVIVYTQHFVLGFTKRAVQRQTNREYAVQVPAHSTANVYEFVYSLRSSHQRIDFLKCDYIRCTLPTAKISFAHTFFIISIFLRPATFVTKEYKFSITFRMHQEHIFYATLWQCLFLGICSGITHCLKKKLFNTVYKSGGENEATLLI